jgi:hypothetical protein
MNSRIRIDVFREETRTLLFRVEIDDIISNNDDINAVETFFNADGTIYNSWRPHGLNEASLIDQYLSEDGNSVDEYTIISITQLNSADLRMLNDLFRSREPNPYVIEDCISFIVSDDVNGLTAPVPGFHFDNEEEHELEPRRLFADDEDDDDDLGPLPDRIPELRRGMRFYDEPPPLTEAERADRARRQQEIAAQMANAAQQQVNVNDQEIFSECVICGEYLDNNAGPGPSDKCQENCNDVVSVCENNHLFHRGCILESCNVGRVNVGSEDYPSFGELSVASRCPLCKAPLVPSCEGLRNKERVEAVNEIINRGGKKKTRKTKNKGKNKKSMKKGKNKKSMKREKRRKTMKKRK